MEHYKYVAIVLVYKNFDDLKECIDSMYNAIPSCRIVVVNSFFDEDTKKRIQSVAEKKNCVFINVENKGYSYGNNRGIEYAKNNLSFDYIIISNPDIIIGSFDDSLLSTHSEYGIIAPKIIAKSGRLQNPMVVVRSRLSEKLEYYGFKKNSKVLIVAGIVVGRISREIAVRRHKDSPYLIYAAHGSFVILSKDTIDKLYPVYDENLFLFAEEGVLAYRAKEVGIKTGQFNQIIIYHKEDGSMRLSNISVNRELRKANLYFYENYGNKGL